MRSLEYLLGPDAMFRPTLAAGLAIALIGSVLSVFVVSKRLAFVGQGISHAAFGGVGVGVMLGLAGAGSDLWYMLVVAVFCVGGAWGIALLSDRGRTSADSAIGILLVGAMALGAVLVHLAVRVRGVSFVPSWEEILFGSILAVGREEAALAWGLSLLIGAALWLTRRRLMLWAFDEQAARALGVRTTPLRITLLSLIALYVVLSMRLAGVVLATALLVLPGASAMRVSERLARVFGLSCAASVAGVLIGLLASFELDAPPGACIVLAMVAIFALAGVWARIVNERAPGVQ